MHRRDALRGVVALLAGTAAGCTAEPTGPRDYPRPPQEPESGPSDERSEGCLRISSIDYREDETGALVVVVVVGNDGDRARSGTVQATVEVGGEELTESIEATVDPDEFTEVELPFEASFDEFELDGSISVDLS